MKQKMNHIRPRNAEQLKSYFRQDRTIFPAKSSSYLPFLRIFLKIIEFIWLNVYNSIFYCDWKKVFMRFANYCILFLISILDKVPSFFKLELQFSSRPDIWSVSNLTSHMPLFWTLSRTVVCKHIVNNLWWWVRQSKQPKSTPSFQISTHNISNVVSQIGLCVYSPSCVLHLSVLIEIQRIGCVHPSLLVQTGWWLTAWLLCIHLKAQSSQMSLVQFQSKSQAKWLKRLPTALPPPPPPPSTAFMQMEAV